jgi:hypothetical protein
MDTPTNFVAFPELGRLGRLGNQLFQIASTIGVAKKYGYYPIFPPWFYAQYFQNPILQFETMPVGMIYYERSFAFQDIFIDGPTHLVGFFQSEKYFLDCESEIRKYFAPRMEFIDQLQNHFGKLLNQKTCSIHVRRTDYVGDPLFADLGQSNYYEDAMEQFESDTVFLCFSDDIPWCKKRFSDRRFVFIEGLKDIADLYLMLQCRGNIIANSTFSWWGAWLNPHKDKKVIAPAKWFQGERANPMNPFLGWPYYRGYHDTKDLLPKEWIQIPVRS